MSWFTPLVLMRHRPMAITARLPCSPPRPLPRAHDPIRVLSTTRAGDGQSGLSVSSNGSSLTIRANGNVLTSARLAESGDRSDCAYELRVTADDWSLTGGARQIGTAWHCERCARGHRPLLRGPTWPVRHTRPWRSAPRPTRLIRRGDRRSRGSLRLQQHWHRCSSSASSAGPIAVVPLVDTRSGPAWPSRRRSRLPCPARMVGARGPSSGTTGGSSRGNELSPNQAACRTTSTPWVPTSPGTTGSSGFSTGSPKPRMRLSFGASRHSSL